jgi:hypothetical protein
VFESRTPGAAIPARRRTNGMPVAIFVGGLVPVTAPLALVAGGLWALLRREQLRRLPGTQRVAVLLGLVAGALSTIVLSAVGLLHRPG